MRNRRINKRVVSIGITILVLLTTSLSIVFAQNMNSASSVKVENADLIPSLEKGYNKNQDELVKMKDELGSWGKVTHTLIMEKYNQFVLKEKVDALYKQGYSLQDISTAAEYAAACGKTPEEILAAKGTQGRYTVKKVKDEQGNDKDIITDNNDMLWDQTIKKLALNLNAASKRLGFSDAKISELRKKGLNQRQIFDTAILSVGFDKNPNEVSNELLKGEGRSVLDQKLSKEWNEKHLTDANALTSSKVLTNSKVLANPDTEREMVIRTAYNITDADISFFKENGIDQINDMAEAKHLAAKYKTTIKKVVQEKKDKATWNEVSKYLGGTDK